MHTKFFTNAGENTLLNKFAGIFTHNKDILFFDALIGFLRASGYFSVRPYLENVPHVRLLVGINVDSIVASYHKKGLLFLADAVKTADEFKKELLKDIQGAGYQEKIETGVVQFVSDVIDKKLEIRAHPSKRLHAKIYIFRPDGYNEYKPGAVITGSSNLTDAGLGTHETNRNYEFNVLSHDFNDVEFATAEFEKLWNEGVSILPQDIREVKNKSYLNRDFTPYEIYMKFLMEYFGENIEYDPSAISDLPPGFKRLSYQIEAVNQGYLLLKQHNGFFLADVVGLGKTVVAALIAKKFFFHNDFPAYRSRTLIIVPPSLKENWQEAIESFQLDNAEIITNGSLHKIVNPKKFDLIIVDEAHSFRNDTADAYNHLQRICKTPTTHRLKDGSFAAKKVILVTATPLNNQPDDIRNLIYLFQDGKNSTLEIGNLQRFFAARTKEYREAKKEENIEIARKKVIKIYETIRTKIVADITIRRTRTDLLAHDQYKNDLIEQNITFPKIGKPVKIYYPLDAALEELYDSTIRILSHKTNGLTYNRYRAIGFLKSEKKAKYHNAELISAQLARIMKTLLVKRIDSSFYAFKKSINRFREATQAMVTMFNNKAIYIAPNLNVSEFIIEGREEELIKLITEAQKTDPTIEICTPDDFEDGFLPGLENDLALLINLCQDWHAVEQDPKFDLFLENLNHSFFDPKLNKANKLVIFSESKETTAYLADRLKALEVNDVLCVDSSNRREKMPVVRENFDANLPAIDQKDVFRILISTEVLAEGINLHRANVVVNYDTPWNSTRLMQRIGRVNRIGTTAERIYVFNFFPTAKVDKDIELEKKALLKLQAFHTAMGEDSQIYSTAEEFATFGLFDKEVEEEKDERLGFLMELRKFKTDQPELYRTIKNMPLRARAGRKDRTKDRTTAVFIRNKRRDAFYFIKPDNEIEEFGFVEMAKVFAARESEKQVELHPLHHQQINAAVNDFREKLQSEAVQHRVVDVSQGPNEKNALAFLDAFTKLQFVSGLELKLIQAAKEAVKITKFQGLQREINQLQKSQKKTAVKPVVLFEKLVKILQQYPLDLDEAGQVAPVVSVLADEELQPDIIISESFWGAAHS
jgi:superfamily II DNA/RNA helicase